MCDMCDAKRGLIAVISQINDSGSSDIGDKFSGLIETVGTSVYAENKEESRAIRLRILSLATAFAKGYIPMKQKAFEERLGEFPLPVDGHRIRLGMRNAMEELFGLYQHRLPWALYGGYMFMASRPNLYVAERLPELGHLLPQDLPWECVDAVWHGLPPCTTLYLHVLAVINRHTGTIPLHGCGCNHYLPPVRDPGDPSMCVRYPEPTDIIAETEVPVSHMLLSIESLARGLPHAMGMTEKALRQHAAVGARRQTATQPKKTCGVKH
jgi:hypothetical protein